MKKGIFFVIISFIMIGYGYEHNLAIVGFFALIFSGAYLIYKLTPLD